MVNLLDNSVSAFSIGANGALTPVAGSPFAAGIGPSSVAITPLVPFASSFAKLEIAKQGFDLNESFTLGANSSGINPVTENVTLQIGTFSVTIPSGSFRQNHSGRFYVSGGHQRPELASSDYAARQQHFHLQGREVQVGGHRRGFDRPQQPGRCGTDHWERFRQHRRDRANP